MTLSLLPKYNSDSFIAKFREKTNALKWDSENANSSLDSLYDAVEELAIDEITYYKGKRHRSAIWSGILRGLGWFFGSVGILLPLSSIGESAASSYTSYSYVFLGAAACLFAANSLFASTDGHIRSVTTQLELEGLVAASKINWSRYVALRGKNENTIEKGFEHIVDFASGLHALTLAETGKWSQSVLAGISSYQKIIDTKASQKDVP